MHDLTRMKQDLQESLSLDKHPVALLIGAGCPVSVRVPNSAGGTDALIPDVAGLTSKIVSALGSDSDFAVVVNQFAADGRTNYTVEDLLSHIRLLLRVVGGDQARGLRADQLKAVETKICNSVAAAVRKDLPDFDNPYNHLAQWIGGVQRKYPLEIFTTNYDLLVEQALERSNLPYFDGFVGSQNPFFDLRSIESDDLPPRWTRLWKIHGSINWRQLPSGKVIRTASDIVDSGLLIHPSELKYEQSRRMPYLALIDRLKSFLRKPSSLLVTLGYSYADEHLNEVLVDGLQSNPKAAAFALLYKNLAEEPGAKRISGSIPGNLTLVSRDCGVARCRSAEWLKDPADPSTSVTCGLGDFNLFAKFLDELVAFGRGTAHA